MSDINKAIVLYIGWNINSYPEEDESRVFERFGKEDGVGLVGRVRWLLRELEQIQPNWDKHDLVNASKKAVDELASRHPELNEEAKSSLEWIYSWWWR